MWYVITDPGPNGLDKPPLTLKLLHGRVITLFFEDAIIYPCPNAGLTNLC